MRSRSKKKNRGVALLPALLVVSMTASMGAVIALGQQLWIRHVEALRERCQADALAVSALEAAADQIETHRAEQATPESMARWSRAIRLPLEDGQSVVVNVESAQGKFNVNRLFAGERLSEADRDVLQRLLASAGQSAELAGPIVASVRRQPLVDVQEIADVPGVDAAAAAALKSFLTALPPALTIDANVASREVLAALYTQAPADVLARLAYARAREPFKNATDVILRGGRVPASEDTFGVRSAYYDVHVSVEVGRARRLLDALLHCDSGLSHAEIIWRSYATGA